MPLIAADNVQLLSAMLIALAFLGFWAITALSSGLSLLLAD